MKFFKILVLVVVLTLGGWWISTSLSQPAGEAVAESPACRLLSEGNEEDLSEHLPLACSIPISDHRQISAQLATSTDSESYELQLDSQSITFSPFGHHSLLPSRFVSFKDDVNFDGYKDLYLMESVGATNEGGGWWIFDPDTGKFSKDKVVGEVHNPEFDSTERKIISFSRGGAAGCAFFLSVNEFRGGRYVETETVFQEPEDEEHASFKRETTATEDDGTQTVRRETFPQENCFDGL